MFKKTMPAEIEIILLCVNLEISIPTEKKIKNLLSHPLDWNEIINTSNRHQVLPFLYYNLNKLNLLNLIPKNIIGLMKNCYYLNLERNLIIEKEIHSFLEAASRQEVNVIPLRGFSLIQTLYPNPALRIMVDVDILAKSKDFEKVRNILIQLNYKENLEATIEHPATEPDSIIVFTKMLSPKLSLPIELHHSLAPARPYAINLPYLWEKTQQITFNKLSLTCLSEEDTFLSLALHLRRHTRRITLKMVIDIAELLNANMSKLDWLYIIKLAKDNRIISTVYFSLYIIKELFDATVPSKIFNEFRPNIIKIALIHFCINKSNFFLLKKWQGAFLRLLLCDKPIDFLLYLWRVSFLERFVTKHCFKKYK